MKKWLLFLVFLLFMKIGAKTVPLSEVWPSYLQTFSLMFSSTLGGAAVEFILVNNKGEPAEGITVKFLWDTVSTNVVSDDSGVVKTLLDENAFFKRIIRVSFPDTLKLLPNIPWETSMSFYNLDNYKGEGKTAKEISIKNKEKIQNGKITFYYSKEIAHKIPNIENFVKFCKYLKDETGLDVPPFIFVFTEVPSPVKIKKEEFPLSKFEIPIPYSLAPHLKSRVDERILFHEMTEMTLVLSLGFYFVDPKTRFIGDGIAEYLSINFSKKIYPELFKKEMKRKIKTLDSLPEKFYDLREFNYEEIEAQKNDYPGYIFSFYLWDKLSKDSKGRLLHKFIDKVLLLPIKDRNLEEISNILTGLSGKKEEELFKIPVEEVKKYFINELKEVKK